MLSRTWPKMEFSLKSKNKIINDYFRGQILPQLFGEDDQPWNPINHLHQLQFFCGKKKS